MFKVTSKHFLKELKRRQRDFALPISARIVVPPELSWWFFQEFGTATLNENHPSSRWYRIDPINAKMLSWPDPGAPGGRVFRSFTFHPGVKPRAIVRKVLGQIRKIVSTDVVDSMVHSGFRREAVKSSLLRYAMAKVLKEIVRSIALELPGTKFDGGKLGGESAADVFEQGARIVDTSAA